MSPVELVALATVLAAVAQLFVAPHRDLGALPVGLGAIAVVVGGLEASWMAAIALCGAAVLFAGAAWRSASQGVARPHLAAAVLAVGVVGATSAWWLPELAPGAPLDRMVGVWVGVIGAATAIGTVLGLDRPGEAPSVRPRRRRVEIE